MTREERDAALAITAAELRCPLASGHVTIGDRHYTGMTDGGSLLAETVDAIDAKARRLVVDSTAVELLRLRPEIPAWSMPEINQAKCPECKGKRSVECTCHSCGDEHTAPCGFCDEIGTVRQMLWADKRLRFGVAVELEGVPAGYGVGVLRLSMAVAWVEPGRAEIGRAVNLAKKDKSTPSLILTNDTTGRCAVVALCQTNVFEVTP